MNRNALPESVRAAMRAPSRADLTEAESGALRRHRTVVLRGQIDDEAANITIAKLLFLESDDPEAPIHLAIDSIGGSVTAGFAIADTVGFVRPRVVTVCAGTASGVAALVLTSGAKGHRHIGPGCHIGMVRLVAPPGESASDFAVVVRELSRMNAALVEKLSQATGRGAPEVEAWIEQERAFSASDAVAVGLVDQVTLL